MTALARKSSPETGSGLWTADQFLEFYMSRPEGEHWQLIDGLAMMMVPANRPHQKLSKNLLMLLEQSLARHQPHLETYYELGLRIPGIEDFNPELDLVVVRRDDKFDRYVDRFFLVAEIISPSNTTEMISRKLDLYKRHPDNRYCVVVEQDSVHIALFTRDGETWTRSDLHSLDDVLRLPAFGLEAALADIYKGTPLGR